MRAQTQCPMTTVNARTAALDAVIFGVDIQSGDVRGDAPKYALVELSDEAIERDVVSHRKLRRRIEAAEPALVATDNVYELAEDKDALVHLLGHLPEPTRLVQVTGAERPEPLSRVANRYDVPYESDPMAEAEAAARLAAGNVGQVVSAFGDTTELKVSRGRSTGSGGFSEDRYTRKIHGAVKRRARSVASELDDAGLEYEQEVTEKYGGYANATFAVAAHPREIPVTTGRDGDVRVEMSRERTDGIEFEPLARRRDHVIVGMDPGTTTAVAVLGLDGEVLDVMSSRTVDDAAVIEWLVERGRPVVVAADVEPMPATVEKLRRSVDAVGWTPAADLPVDEKLHRTRNEATDNDHERDALAAALEAYDAHADRIERVTRAVPPDVEVGAVLGRVLGEDEPIDAAVAALSDDDAVDVAAGPAEPEATEPERTPEEREIRRLKARIDRLESHVDDLRETIAEKDGTIADYQADLETARSEQRREVRRNREVTRLEREVERLEEELAAERERNDELDRTLERLKALWKLDHDDFADVAEAQAGLVPVKVVDQFTADAIAAAQERFGLSRDEVILFRDASGAGRSTAERLVAIEPRLVLRQGGLADVADEVLFEADVPVAPAELVDVQEIDDLAVASEAEVEAAIADWEERAAERERTRQAEMVDRLISEHRAGVDSPER
jgi:predicted RNase H-like nuclease (RuvC/YqgF family)